MRRPSYLKRAFDIEETHNNNNYASKSVKTTTKIE